MKTVKLYGQLGKKFGKEHKLDVRSPAEGIHALMHVVPGLKQYLANEGAQVQYQVFSGSTDLLTEDYTKPTSDSEIIRIVPIVQGSGDLFRVIVGVALIFVAPQFSGTMLFGTSVSLGSIAFNVGVSLILGGVSNMLFGNSTASNTDAAVYERPENKPSYSFDGPINTIKQGNPVSVGYGQLLIGSQVVSAGLRTAPY